MKKLRFVGKHFLLAFCLVSLLSIITPASVNAGICEYALLHCLGDAGAMLSKAIVGQVIYCLNGYSFCLDYIAPFL